MKVKRPSAPRYASRTTPAWLSDSSDDAWCRIHGLDGKRADNCGQPVLPANASLLPMPQIKRGVQTGQVQVGEILLTAYSNEDPFFDADAVPFLVPDFAGALCDPAGRAALQ